MASRLICAACGKPFRQLGRETTCSPACYNAQRKGHRRKPARRRHCRHCGKIIPIARGQSDWCSDACRLADSTIGLWRHGRICSHCGGPIPVEALHSTLTCSPACRKARRSTRRKVEPQAPCIVCGKPCPPRRKTCSVECSQVAIKYSSTAKRLALAEHLEAARAGYIAPESHAPRAGLTGWVAVAHAVRLPRPCRSIGIGQANGLAWLEDRRLARCVDGVWVPCAGYADWHANPVDLPAYGVASEYQPRLSAGIAEMTR